MSEMNEAAAVWVNIDDLTPWDQNPRVNDGSVEAVADSIKRFGFGAPIIARTTDRTIIAGHTRLKAAITLGLTKVPVRFLDLDPADAALLALADNRIGEIAEWDSEALSDILKGLNDEGVDLEVTGFTPEELEDLLGAAEALPDEVDPGATEADDLGDEIPEEIPALTQPGEVITLGDHTLHCEDCVEALKAFDENTFDAIVCDPPYGIGFMNKQWDCEVPGDEWAQQCYRVLKPGGHLIAFGSTRTIHRLGVTLEDSNFEIRDCIAWIQWQGFPKSLDLSRAFDKSAGAEREIIGFDPLAEKRTPKHNTPTFGDFRGQTGDVTKPSTEEATRWNGWGTGLKPAFEPAFLVRKPIEGTVIENVRKWGTGGLNINGCRFKPGDPAWPGPNHDHSSEWDGLVTTNIGPKFVYGAKDQPIHKHDLTSYKPEGRWPANIYHAIKPGRREREQGCENLPSRTPPGQEGRKPGSAGLNSPRSGTGRTAQSDRRLPFGSVSTGRTTKKAVNYMGLESHGDRIERVRNIHPTVKPIKLMRWLVRLVTPPEGVVLDTFAGSGTTLLAAQLEGVASVGIEREAKYCDIIRARLSHYLTGEE